MLQTFYKINTEMIRNLRFQEINEQAMGKIIKSMHHTIIIRILLTWTEFDKRTALGVKDQIFSEMSKNSFMSDDLSRAVCFTMHEKLLSTIPQLDDYLCPICSQIAVAPSM